MELFTRASVSKLHFVVGQIILTPVQRALKRTSPYTYEINEATRKYLHRIAKRVRKREAHCSSLKKNDTKRMFVCARAQGVKS